MKILKMSVIYTDEATFGQLAYEIVFSNSGAEYNVDDIFKKLDCFNYFVFKGNLHEQLYDITKLIKKLNVKEHKHYEIFVSTNHKLKFPGTNNKYFILLNNDTKEEILNHYCNEKFIIYIKDMDELYTADLLIKDKGVSKNNIILILQNIDDELILTCKVLGYSINIKIGEQIGQWY